MLSAVRRIEKVIPRRRRKRLSEKAVRPTEDEVLEKEYHILVELGVPA